jgi:hypothetical protein
MAPATARVAGRDLLPTNAAYLANNINQPGYE